MLPRRSHSPSVSSLSYTCILGPKSHSGTEAGLGPLFLTCAPASSLSIDNFTTVALSGSNTSNSRVLTQSSDATTARQVPELVRVSVAEVELSRSR